MKPLHPSLEPPASHTLIPLFAQSSWEGRAVSPTRSDSKGPGNSHPPRHQRLSANASLIPKAFLGEPAYATIPRKDFPSTRLARVGRYRSGLTVSENVKTKGRWGWETQSVSDLISNLSSKL